MMYSILVFLDARWEIVFAVSDFLSLYIDLHHFFFQEVLPEGF